MVTIQRTRSAATEWRLWLVDLITEEEHDILKVLSRPNRKYNIHSDKFRTMVPSRAAAADEACQQDDDEKGQYVYYVPLLWATDLVNQASTEGRLKAKNALRLIEVCIVVALLCDRSIVVNRLSVWERISGTAEPIRTKFCALFVNLRPLYVTYVR